MVGWGRWDKVGERRIGLTFQGWRSLSIHRVSHQILLGYSDSIQTEIDFWQ